MHSLDRALTLTRDGESLSAPLSGDYSNGPIGAPPEAGFPFGGLLAALCAQAMRQGLDIGAPLRTLSVQYLAAARFGQDLGFAPRLLRGGRSTAFAAVDAGQDGRATHHATALFGPDDADAPVITSSAPPPPLDSLDPEPQLAGPMAPRFSQHVDYVFDDGPRIMRGRPGDPAVERMWMRLKDGRPLDEAGLCYLLDAIYPPAWTIGPRPAPMTTVDLRYDVLAEPTPASAPGGWAFFEFRMLDLGLGWTVDEAVAWGADGAPLALSRQRRKLLPPRPAAG